MRELVFFPQLGRGLIVFGFRIGLSLDQTGHFLAELFALVADGANPAVLLGRGLLTLQTALGRFADRLLFFGNAALAGLFILLDLLDLGKILFIQLLQRLQALLNFLCALAGFAGSAFQRVNGCLCQRNVVFLGQMLHARRAQFV